MSRFERLVKGFNDEELDAKFMSSLTTEEIDKIKEFGEKHDEDKLQAWGEEYGKELINKWAVENDHLTDEELVIGGALHGIRILMEHFEVNE